MLDGRHCAFMRAQEETPEHVLRGEALAWKSQRSRRTRRTELSRSERQGGVRSALKTVQQQIDFRSERGIVFQQLSDLIAAVQHGRMVSAAEMAPDVGQRIFRQFSDEVHGHLPRHRYGLRAFAGGQQGEWDLEVGADHLLNALHGNRWLASIEHVPQDGLGHLLGEQTLLHELALKDEAIQRPLKFSHIGFDVIGDHIANVVGEINVE